MVAESIELPTEIMNPLRKGVVSYLAENPHPLLGRLDLFNLRVYEPEAEGVEYRLVEVVPTAMGVTEKLELWDHCGSLDTWTKGLEAIADQFASDSLTLDIGLSAECYETSPARYKLS